MDKAGPINARPEANIGRPARQNLGNCSHSKWSVIRRTVLPSPTVATGTPRFRKNDHRKQSDGWLTLSEENRLDLRQIDCKMLRFESD
jgi:hypothetical protein